MVNKSEQGSAADSNAAEVASVQPSTEVAEPEAATPVVAEIQVSAPEPEAATPTEADKLQLVLPTAEMTDAEKFQATTRLIFLAPDVPPVQIRARRNELRQLDEMLDSRFSSDAPDGFAERESRGNRERTDRRHDRNERQDRSDRNDRQENADRDDSESSHSRRRGRRRTSGQDAPNEDESARRSQTQAITEPQKLRGSTRLEAKKQRRRDGRDAGRRRTVITESEFLARRESVDREMVVRTTDDRIQIAVLEDKVLVEHYVARSSETSLIGNVYLGRVQNVLPSMEAAFVDIGRGRNAVLYSGEVDWSEFEGGNTARRIENALKPGDHVLVQVTKDPVGHKGARLTSQVSLPGRFLVYVPGGSMNGISRKLPDTERARLKKILKEVLPNGAGVIVRTAAEGATEEQLTHDVQRLTRQWESIQKRVAKGGGPAMLHSEPDMLIKIVRDVFNEDFQKLVISGETTHEVIETYLSQVAPELMERVERYSGDADVFDGYRITEQIAKALDRKVWLPSGGSLVIDRTEAMTVVDVNTGKFVGSGGNLEETVTKNNLEAAEEIVRQLRLRDIGGIIVVDFIDMVLESNRDLVLRRMVECLSRDRTKHQVAEVTSLGLIQMTRKKLGLGLLESFSEPCDVCAGRGIVVHHEPTSKPRESGGNHQSSRNKRGKNQHQQTPQPQQNSQAHQQSTQAHAISDGAKSMLAQVAASTIGGQKADEQLPKQSSEKPAAEPVTGKVPRKTGGRRVSRDVEATPVATSPAAPEPVEPVDGPQAPATVPEHTSLLDSVLDALPQASGTGRGKSQSRRVTTSAIRGGADAKDVNAEEAKRVLEQALDATLEAKAQDS